MKRSLVETVRFVAALVLIGGALSAQATILVTSNITTSETWTSNNVYNLQQQIYVEPGATLTIEAGTIIASTTGLGGSLAITQGAQLFVQGTKSAPVIFTSEADRATWTGNDPTTGTWREGVNEWGNITVMGTGFISENATAGNTAVPSASNVAAMEGLVAGFAGDPNVIYGGGNDDDDSGSIHYVSLRYGGKVIGLNNELNGLSLGGIGRNTDIHHVEIMNNVDDGIEIWGGTVNLKYLSIWNIGDDSFDLDQGWRGKAQFGLIVQGYSANASQGSGVGDNMVEVDGAEDSDWQPVTTSTIYNFTLVGQPVDGDRALAYRDNARLQFRNSIVMDCGEHVVGFDNVDGDGANGYGHNGTLSWASTWTTPFTATSTVNAPANPAAFYTVQTSGTLLEISDSVFHNNNHGSAYTTANSVNVFAPANNNVMQAASSPIQAITRGPAVIRGGKVMQPVTFLNPLPANDALISVASAPNDGFFTPAGYRGAFAPNHNWLCGWTASDAFGFTQGAPVAGPGQAGDMTAAAMDISGACNLNGNAVGTAGDLNGPFFSDVHAGDQIVFTFNGQPNQPVLLLAGTQLNPGLQNLGAIGFFDIGFGFDPMTGLPFGLTLVGNGLASDFVNSLFNTGPTGTSSISLPAILPPSTMLNFQGIVLNTSTVIRMTNSVQLLQN